jgi:hypothetical protein
LTALKYDARRDIGSSRFSYHSSFGRVVGDAAGVGGGRRAAVGVSGIDVGGISGVDTGVAVSVAGAGVATTVDGALPGVGAPQPATRIEISAQNAIARRRRLVNITDLLLF